MKRLCLIAATLTLGLTNAAYAEKITASGCVEPGVEGGCLILKSSGKTYQINSANPRPKAGTYGTVSGEIFEGASFCMQGTNLVPATWSEDPTRSCPEGK